jgi:hypothetical protein
MTPLEKVFLFGPNMFGHKMFMQDIRRISGKRSGLGILNGAGNVLISWQICGRPHVFSNLRA